MPEKRRRFDREFRAGAVRIVRETNKPIAQVAADAAVRSASSTHTRCGFFPLSVE